MRENVGRTLGGQLNAISRAAVERVESSVSKRTYRRVDAVVFNSDDLFARACRMFVVREAVKRIFMGR